MEESQSPTPSNKCKAYSNDQNGSVQNVDDNNEQPIHVVKDSGEHADENIGQFQNDNNQPLYAKNKQQVEDSDGQHVDENTEQVVYENMGQPMDTNSKQNLVNIKFHVDKKIGQLLAETSDHLQEKCSMKSLMEISGQKGGGTGHQSNIKSLVEISGQKGGDTGHQSYMPNNEYLYVLHSETKNEKNSTQQPFGNAIVTQSAEAIHAYNTGSPLSEFVKDSVIVISSSSGRSCAEPGESSHVVIDSAENSIISAMESEEAQKSACNSADTDSSAVDKNLRSVCRTAMGVDRAFASKGCKDPCDEIPGQDSLTLCSFRPDMSEGGIQSLEDQGAPPKFCRLQPGCTGDHGGTRDSKQQLRSARTVSEREGIFVPHPMLTVQVIHPSQGSQMEDMDVGLQERLYYTSDLPDLNGTNLEEYLPLTDVTNTSSTLDDTNEVPIDSMVDEHKNVGPGDNVSDKCIDPQVEHNCDSKSLKHDVNQEERKNYPGYYEVVQQDAGTQLEETSAHGEEAIQSSPSENQNKEDSEVESSSGLSEDEGVTVDDEDTLSSEEMLSIQKSEDHGRRSCFTPDVDEHRGTSPEMACLSHGSPDYMCGKQNNTRIPRLVVYPGERQQHCVENLHMPLQFDQNEESTPSNSNTFPFLNPYASNVHYGDVNLAELNVTRKGLKRKFDLYNQHPHVPESQHSYYKDSVYSSLTQHAEYNYLCQYYQGYGRPPDVSTWTAVTSPFSQYSFTAPPCSVWKGLNYNMIASEQADTRDTGVLNKNPPAYSSDPFFPGHYYPSTACTSSRAVSEGFPPSYYNHMTANKSVPSSFSPGSHNEMFSTSTSVAQDPSMHDKQSLVNHDSRYQHGSTTRSYLQQAWSDTNLVNTGPNTQVFSYSENTNPQNTASFNYFGEDQKHPDTKRPISSSIRDTLVPFKARNTKIVCTVNDLYTKTVKSILKKAEENYQQEKEGVLQPQDLSVHKPTETSSKLTEQYRSECRSKSPISALNSALDLSQKSATKRKQQQYPEGEMIGQPAVAVPVVPSTSVITSPSESSCLSETTSTSAASVVSTSTSQQERASGTEVSAGYYMPLLQKGAYPAGTLLQAVPRCLGPIRSSLVSPYYSVLPVYSSTSPYQHPSTMMTAIPLYANKASSVQNQAQVQPAVAASPCEEVTGATSQQYDTQVTGYHGYPLIHAAMQGDQGHNPTNVGGIPSILTYLPGPAHKQEVKILPPPGQTKKTFKPRHFDFTKLCIGTFMYTCALSDYSRTARIKFLYSKRKLVYEFQLNDSNDVSTTERKQLTEIDIPFSSIVGLWAFERELRLEVNCSPKMFLGHKGHEKQRKFGAQACAAYDRKKTVDLTNGQLTNVPYHYINLKMCVGDKIKSELCSFDMRFEELLKTSFIVNTNKSLVSPDSEPSLNHPLLYPIPPRSALTQVPSVQSSTSPGRTRQLPLLPKKKGSQFAGCHCNTSCRSLQCSCCVHAESCTPACVCHNCHNPLNLLLRMGIPSAIAQTDLCLMDNIYRLDNLDDYLNATVRLECCGIQMLLLRCVPGSFKCPNTHCNARYCFSWCHGWYHLLTLKYPNTNYKPHYGFSWCHAMLCNEGVAPRNHCTKCGRCTDFRNVHCQKCNKCYFAGISGFKCPTCKVEEMERNQQSPAGQL